MKNKKAIGIIVLLLVSISILGCIGKDNPQTATNGDSSSQMTDEYGNVYDWCTPGNVINPSNESDAGFTIKGITEYQGKDVCEVEWKYDGGSVIEYFTEDGDTTIINKDVNGNIVNNTNEENETISDTGETATNETITNTTIYIPKGWIHTSNGYVSISGTFTKRFV